MLSSERFTKLCAIFLAIVASPAKCNFFPFSCWQHLMCAGLWCLVEGDTSCKTKLDPPLDGTECGADKVKALEKINSTS